MPTAMSRADWTRIRHFARQDFQEEWEGRRVLWGDNMARELIFPLDMLREMIGAPIYPTSSGRLEAHQRRLFDSGLSATDDSYHEASPQDGTVQAVDVVVGDGKGELVHRAYQEARRMGAFTGIGVYEWGGLHLDVGDGWASPRPATWTWTRPGGYGSADPYTVQWTLGLVAPPGPWVRKEAGPLLAGLLVALGLAVVVAATG